MRRLVTVIVLVAAAAAALLMTGASDKGSKSKKYELTFDNAFGLVEGGDLKVGGVRAGQTTGFDISKDKPPKAIVKAEITEEGFADFRKDARCEIQPQSLIGEFFVDCQPGSAEEKLEGRLPVEQTSSTIPADLINNILRRPYRERLRLIIAELGAGLAGRPQDLSEVLRRAHPGLRETSKVLNILGNQRGIIRDFISDSDTVVAELEGNKRDVARFVTEAADTAEISATRRADIARSFEKLPRFLDELRPTMAALEDLADEQTPLLRDLQIAAPDLNSFLEELGPFAESSLPAIRSLGKASKRGRAAVNESKTEINELRKLAKNAPGLGKPLRQFLQTIDDRKRSYRRDPRALETLPPAPDKNSDGKAGAGGFTGMESFLNYFYWQALSINSFDSIGHQLREILFTSQCSAYETDPDEELIKLCNNYLGPYQPGVTDPEPAAKVTTAEARERRNPDPRKARARRGAGEPEAPPLPGQRDISKPQVTLPPALQTLVDQLRKRGQVPNTKTPAVPGPGGQQVAPDQLLDFLLAP